MDNSFSPRECQCQDKILSPQTPRILLNNIEIDEIQRSQSTKNKVSETLNIDQKFYDMLTGSQKLKIHSMMNYKKKSTQETQNQNFLSPNRNSKKSCLKNSICSQPQRIVRKYKKNTNQQQDSQTNCFNVQSQINEPVLMQTSLHSRKVQVPQ